MSSGFVSLHPSLSHGTDVSKVKVLRLGSWKLLDKGHLIRTRNWRVSRKVRESLWVMRGPPIPRLLGSFADLVSHAQCKGLGRLVGGRSEGF